MIEVMISIGLIGVAALASASISNNALQGAAFIRRTEVVSDVMDLMRALLTDPTYCASMLGGKVLTPSGSQLTLDNVAFKQVNADGKPGSDLFMAGATLENGVSISKLSISTTAPLGPNRYLASLNSEFVAKQGYVKNMKRSLGLILDTTTTGGTTSLAHCSLTGGASGPGASPPPLRNVDRAILTALYRFDKAGGGCKLGLPGWIDEDTGKPLLQLVTGMVNPMQPVGGATMPCPSGYTSYDHCDELPMKYSACILSPTNK